MKEYGDNMKEMHVQGNTKEIQRKYEGNIKDI